MDELPPEVFAALRAPAPGSLTAIVGTTDADGPHLAPFGSLQALDGRRLRFGCDRGHATFANLVRDPRVAVFIAAPPDVAVTIFGRAAIGKEAMELIPSDAVVEIEVEAVKDDMLPGAAIETATTYSVAGELTDFLAAYLAEVESA